MDIWKEYYVNPNDYIADSVPSAPYVCQLLSSYPAWFTPYLFGGFWLTGYEFTAPSTFGQYTISFECVLAPFTTIQYNIVINVGLYNVTDVEVCCAKSKQCNIAWLNREGGWSNWIFTGVRTVKVKQTTGKTFKRRDTDGDLTQHYSEKEGIYDALICTTKDINKTQLDSLDSLAQSIQAFAYNEEDDRFNIPVLIDSKSYTKYKTSDKFFEVKLSFIFSTEIKIQTQ